MKPGTFLVVRNWLVNMRNFYKGGHDNARNWTKQAGFRMLVILN
jgi:hypothetical protein